MHIEEIIAKTLSSIEPGTFRHNLLDTAKRFKENWFEFGEKLTKVATEKHYEKWGYSSFEEYCRVEAKIKKNTAVKLTNAWFFLSQEEPELAKNTQHIPELDAVKILQKAKADERWTPEMYEKLRESAFVKQRVPSTLAKQFREAQAIIEKKGNSEPNANAVKEVDKLKQELRKKQAPEKFYEYLNLIEEFLKTQI